MRPLDRLLLTAHEGIVTDSLESFARARVARLAELGLTGTYERAVASGMLARCVGFAFAGGYREALQSLVPSLPVEALAALCATEEGGAHPQAIRTTLTSDEGGWRLRGHKRWVTAAGSASRLLVVASEGQDEQGRNRLAVVEVGAGEPGVGLRAMPPAPFAPEVPHLEVQLEDVRVEPGARLPGDGYARYLKPFRTVEDVHVMGALVGYVVAECSRLGLGRGTADDPRPELLALGAALGALAFTPTEAATHLALEGTLRLLRGALDRVEPLWEQADGEGATRWRRDRVLLAVASKARAARTAAAWREVEGAV